MSLAILALQNCETAVFFETSRLVSTDAENGGRQPGGPVLSVAQVIGKPGE